MSALAVLGLALLGLLLLVLLGLAAPVSFRLEVRRQERPRARVSVRALFGLVKTELHSARPAREEEKKKPRRRTSARQVLAALRTPGLGAAVWTCLRRLWRSVRVPELDGSLELGLDDPADTGLVWGLLGPAVALTAQRHPGLRAVPVFDGERLEVEGKGTAVVVPLELLGIALAFLLTPATVRAWVAARRAR